MVTLLLFVIGSFLVVVFRFVAFGVHQDMIWHTVGLKTGYLELAAYGWPVNHDLTRAMTVEPGLLRELADTSGVRILARRLQGPGLVNHRQSSRLVNIRGYDWSVERQITTLDSKIRQGRYGRLPADALVGQQLARQLGLEIGSELALIASQLDGSIGSVQVQVSGIYRAADMELDTATVVISLERARELFAPDVKLAANNTDLSFLQSHDLSAADIDQLFDVTTSAAQVERYTSIGLGVGDYRQAEKVYQELRRSYAPPVRDGAVAAEDSKIYAPVIYFWDQLNPGIVQLVWLDQVQGEMLIGFLLLILAAGVFNNVQMSIQERQREFGIMLAMGTRQWTIVLQLFAEMLFVLVPATALGLLLGSLLSQYWHVHPIVFSGEYAEAYLDMGFQPRITAIVDPGELWIALASLLVPAWIFTGLACRRVFRLSPVQIINTI
ncbi:MAG: ABC transporter permease [Leptospiraceae bacterium]|nr:ABC transporter permease [Leptospiraceae bacterium]